jgi:hypothetical protein
MAQQDLYMGLGSMAYALSKSDGCLQSKELRTLEQMLRNEQHGEIALYVLDLKARYEESVEEAYQFAFRRFAENRHELDKDIKKKFHLILERVAESHDGISGKEDELLRRFRRDINRL